MLVKELVEWQTAERLSVELTYVMLSFKYTIVKRFF
jgi:hypothetical protein